MGEKTSKQISPFEAGMVGGLVVLVSFLGGAGERTTLVEKYQRWLVS